MSQPHTILLADADRAGLASIAEGLRGAGYTVVVAADTEQALLKMKLNTPTVVCLDVHLPPWGAFEIYDQLRAIHPSPIVLMLERLDDAICTGIAAKGIEDMLLKPLDVIEAIDKVAWYCDPEV